MSADRHLIFGGPYGNLQATEAMLAQARALGIRPENVICTGDVVAYCGDAAATVAIIRDAGIRVVMGNCEESLGQGLDDCGCGFDDDSACDVLSRQWYAHAERCLSADDKAWMAALPRRIDVEIGGLRLAIIHGGVTNISRYVFASTPGPEKIAEFDALESPGIDGVIGGHCGLAFTDIIDGKLWHNPGVIGMPANDGTPRTWYSVLEPTAEGIEISRRALDYDHAAASGRMRAEGLPEAYARTLGDGLWPNMDILPDAERQLCGHPMTAEIALFSP
ncbi:MAG: metallophosphoesterase family protein [Alphaproteobacteria bacterium]